MRESALSSDPEPRGVQRGPWGLSPGEVWDEMDLKGALMILSFEHLFFANLRDLGFLGLHFLPLMPAVPWRRVSRC